MTTSRFKSGNSYHFLDDNGMSVKCKVIKTEGYSPFILVRDDKGRHIYANPKTRQLWNTDGNL